MSATQFSRFIQYYRQCYQASFHASEGHGIFDRDDVVVLAVANATNRSDFCLTENHLSAWLVDSDQTELVLFDGICLQPSPNATFTTEVHYAPLQLLSTAQLVEQSLAITQQSKNGHFLAMLQSIELEAIKENAANYDELLTEQNEALPVIEITEVPSVDAVSRWLIQQTKKVSADSRCPVQILALVPKDLRSYQAKATFVGHLDTLATSANKDNTFPVLRELLMGDKKQTLPSNKPLLDKVGGLGFGKQLAMPSLSTRQIQALQNAFTQPISLLQGPPGTGKTHALATLTVVLASLNKSVLITAQSDAALDVLQKQLVDGLKVDRSLIVRFGKGQRNGRFGQQLSRLITQTDQQKNDQDDVLSEYESLLNMYEQVTAAQKSIEKTIAEFPTPSPALLMGNGRISERFKRWLLWQRQHKQQGSLLPQIEALQKNVDQHHASLGAVASAVLKQRFQRAFSRNPVGWSQQSLYVGQLGVFGAAQKICAQGEQPVALQSGIGIWLATLDDVPECTDGNFDWVIVDEATQANMASVLPAIASAKSLVVAGDPRQLRHYSFLSGAQEERIARELELQEASLPRYRSTSFFDFVHDHLMNSTQAKAITLLDEHYRSVPPLMRFNSEAFYNDEVKVLTGLNADDGLALQLNWQYVNGQRVNKVNTAEVNAVVQHLKSLIEKQASDAEKTSYGVLSFFRDQSEALKKAILSELTLQQIRDHRIKIGTPYSFQGEERDHMLISCAVDRDAVAGTWNYLNKPDVFNVATSRARSQQTLFLSVPANALPASSILRRYHDFSLPTKTIAKPDQIEPWLSQLVTAITQGDTSDLRVEYHHQIADIDIDLLLSQQHKRIAIDLIGFPGDRGIAVHVSRYCTLARVGILLYPLTAFDWMFNPAKVIDEIRQWLHQKPDRLNQLPSTGTSVTRKQSNELTTAPFFSARPMTLVNERVWQDFLDCAQAPELSVAWGFNLNIMVEKLTQMDQLLPKLFQTGTVTFQRYKSAINSALEPYLENLSTYRLLHAQVWESNSADPDYWQSLTQPIFARHEKITEVLLKLHREMQLEVAKGGKGNEFALTDIESLAEQLKEY